MGRPPSSLSANSRASFRTRPRASIQSPSHYPTLARNTSRHFSTGCRRRHAPNHALRRLEMQIFLGGDKAWLKAVECFPALTSLRASYHSRSATFHVALRSWSQLRDLEIVCLPGRLLISPTLHTLRYTGARNLVTDGQGQIVTLLCPDNAQLRTLHLARDTYLVSENETRESLASDARSSAAAVRLEQFVVLSTKLPHPTASDLHSARANTEFKTFGRHYREVLRTLHQSAESLCDSTMLQPLSAAFVRGLSKDTRVPTETADALPPCTPVSVRSRL